MMYGLGKRSTPRCDVSCLSFDRRADVRSGAIGVGVRVLGGVSVWCAPVLCVGTLVIYGES